jgi:hypothetical protein
MVRRGTPEGKIKAEVLKYLKLRQIKAWSNPSGAVRIRPGKFMSFGLKGSSDILGVLPGGRFLAEVQALGGLAVTVRGWRERADMLREAGYAMKDMPLFEGRGDGTNQGVS